MTFRIVLAFAVPFAIGYLLASLFWPVGAASRFSVLIRIFLAAGLGQGVTSCLLFLWLLARGRVISSGYVAVEMMFLLALLVAGWRRAGRGASIPAFETQPRHERWLAIAFSVAVISALLASLYESSISPHGGWDAWAIYGLRARGIFRGGMYWRDGFSALISWSHPDYPLLLPLAIARTWLYAGSESVAPAAVLSVLFAFATLGLMCSALAALRGKSQAFLAGAVLLGYTYFIGHASSQYADLPAMFFLTAALVLLALRGFTGGHGLLILAGMATGLAAWSKNEGLMFVPAIAAGHLVATRFFGGARTYRRQLLFFSFGLLPVLAVVLLFKASVAPSSEIVTGMAGSTGLAKLLDLRRYVFIAKEFFLQIASYSGYGVNLAYLLAIYMACVGLSRSGREDVVRGASVLGLAVFGYFAVYLLTPYDLAWHLRNSLERILLQLWPGFVFTFFLAASTPDEILRTRKPGSLPQASCRCRTSPT